MKFMATGLYTLVISPFIEGLLQHIIERNSYQLIRGATMKILVQKYGGTSLQDKKSRKYVLEHVQDALQKEFKIVVVVSAIGRKPKPYATDTLLNLIDYPNHYNPKREIDLLMSCGEIISAVVLSNELLKNGISSIALTGAQAGIITTEDFNQAKIEKVETKRLLKEFERHDVIVVAGFQGISKTGEITTIGRGGSDTTAAALGAALQAKRIDIFTDVDGIMTADPRIVEKARPLEVVTYTEICNLAYQGANVIHPRAVEIAMQARIPIRIRSTYSKEKGTLVTNQFSHLLENDFKDRIVTGIAHIAGITQIKVNMKAHAYKQSIVFKALAEQQISVDFINISPSQVVFTVSNDVKDQAVAILESLGFPIEITDNCAKVSAVGAGMTGVPGVAAKIVQALTDKNVQILQSADSHTTIWVLVKEEDLKVAVNALHDVFNHVRDEKIEE